ncbi:tetratricopeptide repeat protein [Helicobacter sp. 23-1044]
MDKFISFFVDFYKDPLFSIIIIVSIIVLVAVADYTRNRFKQKEKADALKNFAENFNFYEIDSNLNNALNLSKVPHQTLILIAQIYIKSGNFDDAIKIYLAILDKISDLKDKIEVFELLGVAYYRAGFMQRAKDIFIEILKHNPRNANALSLLMQTYETLGEYANALEVVSCIEEIKGEKSLQKTRTCIKMLVLINDSLMSSAVREGEILRVMNDGAKKLALQYFLQHNEGRFWEIINAEQNLHNFIDLLWRVPSKSGAINANKQIADIYRAKGIIDDGVECEIFELEALRILRKHSHKRADLSFKYKCTSCQAVFPFESHRCQNCAEIGEMSVILEIIER